MYIHATPLRKKGGDQLCVCVYVYMCRLYAFYMRSFACNVEFGT